VLISIQALNPAILEATSYPTEVISTGAGNIDFYFPVDLKEPSIFVNITSVNKEENTIQLADGSVWEVSNINSVKNWEKSPHIVLGSSQSLFSPMSGYKYALVNLDQKLAEAMSLKNEPRPSEYARYIKALDTVNDIVTLNDDKQWIVHSSDRGDLSKMRPNDRIIVGVNTGVDRDKSPYLLINTSTNLFIRTQLVE
jgi:hypothetical protein